MPQKPKPSELPVRPLAGKAVLFSVMLVIVTLLFLVVTSIIKNAYPIEGILGLSWGEFMMVMQASYFAFAVGVAVNQPKDTL